MAAAPDGVLTLTAQTDTATITVVFTWDAATGSDLAATATGSGVLTLTAASGAVTRLEVTAGPVPLPQHLTSRADLATAALTAGPA